MNKPRQWTVKRKSQSEATIWEGNLFVASVAAAPRDKDPYLIAAAPELLEALKMALVQIVQDNDGRGVDHEHRLTETQVRAAVAKAERGEQ